MGSASHGRSSGMPETSMTSFVYFFVLFFWFLVGFFFFFEQWPFVLTISLKPEEAAGLVLEVCQMLRLERAWLWMRECSA